MSNGGSDGYISDKPASAGWHVARPSLEANKATYCMADCYSALLLLLDLNQGKLWDQPGHTSTAAPQTHLLPARQISFMGPV